MYLPETYLHETKFPESFSKDLFFQVRVIGERWRRMFPLIEYFPFKGDVTVAPALPGGIPTVVGEPGGSALDALWNETVPVSQLADGVWQQPHDGTGAAANPELFYPVVNLNMQIRREAKDKELKKYGFDQLRDLLVFVPTAALDAVGVTARAGDEFIWDGYRYFVEQVESTGYWKNTNLTLYVVMNCTQKKVGS